MNILLLNAPFHRRLSRATRGPAVGRGGTLFYPYWLAYATGVLEQAGHHARLVDAIARRMSVEDILQLAVDVEPRLIVIDVTAPTVEVDLETAKQLKEATGASLLAVGPHVTALPESVIRPTGAFDFVARGEYDYTVRELADCLENSRPMTEVRGLSFRENGFITHNLARPLIEDLDALPFVSDVYKRHLCIDDYFYAANLHPEVAIVSGRGCPYKCHWCLYPQTMSGHRFRARSPENFVDELEWIGRELPRVREVFIEDDTFTADRPRVHQVCELIRKRGLRTRWACNIRPDVDRDTLRTMKSAGCRMVLAGFESGNQAVLDGMSKGLKLTRARQFARDVRDVGLVLHACFVAGGVGESRSTLEETLQFALEIEPTTAQFTPIMVYPGTRAYDWARQSGHLISSNFAEWITVEGTHKCQVSTPELSAEDIQGFCDYARRRFYLRPSYWFRTVAWASIRPVEWPRMLRGFRNLAHFLIRYGKRAPT